MDSPPVPGELLVDIFLRLPDPADLARASAACVSFRRLVTDRSFLRRYRKLHAPPFLGFLDQARNFHPAVPPHPSAPAASAVALAADFSFAFLPAYAPATPSRWVFEAIRDGRVLPAPALAPAPACRWVVEDIRDGRVLLGRSFNIVVCDPLHRQYLLLPPVPDKLFREVYIQRHIFLVPPAGSVDKEEETAFRVFWMARRGDKLVAIVFSSSTGQWQDGPSHSWRDSFGRFLKLPGTPNFPGPQYAYGCFYWATNCRKILMVLDTQRMDFSIVVAPPEAKGSAHVLDIFIVEAGEGRTGIFCRPKDRNDFSYSIRQDNCVSSSPWRFDRTVSLDFNFSVMGSAGRHLFLFQQGSASLDRGCFSLDVKTFQLQRVFVSNSYIPYGHTYSNFPPSLLSTPTISSGVEEGAEKAMLKQGCAATSSAESPRPSE